MPTRTLYIGFDGDKFVSAVEIQKPIKPVKSLDCRSQHRGESLSWNAFDNPDGPRTLFQAILNDRPRRESNLMMDHSTLAGVDFVTCGVRAPPRVAVEGSRQIKSYHVWEE